MLMQAETLAHQTSGAVADDRVAQRFPGYHPNPRAEASGARQNIGDQASANQAPALRARAREFTLLLQALGAREAQVRGRVAGHED
jgi:hypothetical protein